MGGRGGRGGRREPRIEMARRPRDPRDSSDEENKASFKKDSIYAVVLFYLYDREKDASAKQKTLIEGIQKRLLGIGRTEGYFHDRAKKPSWLKN